MYYLSNKFSKITERSELSAPSAVNFQFWWPTGGYFGQIVVFQTDYDKIEL